MIEKRSTTLNRSVPNLLIATKWNPNIEGHCIDHISLLTVALATDVLLDGEWFLSDIFSTITQRVKQCIGLILIPPIYNAWDLQMRTRHKIAVIGLFLLGGFTTTTGILRLHFLSFAYASLKDPLFNDITCRPPSRLSYTITFTDLQFRQLRSCTLLVNRRDQCWRCERLHAHTSSAVRSLWRPSKQTLCRLRWVHLCSLVTCSYAGRERPSQTWYHDKSQS